ncbi:hypothetical protein [Natranaeroarchaeum sulfidigenes]|uniref:Uncharacterized protein n=1 Tax=Natranaeroarchaeum sulfidigenes TaxID=2784880 RepID=A0A897MPB4_9EURY|nr:hypothetical protein [Natranaeroarchaeum sulfidigenes]QSG02397.1 Uncharacterized protein AArcS_1179 [Natranaeroarchaeum sulfidigenes]
MSTTEHDAESGRSNGMEDQSVEFLHDDRVDPNEVTLFTPGDDSIATEWITADVRTAVALDDVR